MKNDALNSLFESSGLLNFGLNKVGDLNGDKVEDAIRYLSLRVFVLSNDVIRDWDKLNFYTLAIITRSAIEAVADSCVIACGNHGNDHAEKFIAFSEHSEEIFNDFVSNKPHEPIAQDKQDWCDLKDKKMRVASLQKKHKALSKNHDFRNNYDFLSLFVHTSPYLIKNENLSDLKSLETVVFSALCTAQCEHLLKAFPAIDFGDSFQE